MINVVNACDENKNQNLKGAHDAILTNLKDEKNVIFEWGEIKMPEVKFTNVQEALDYIKKQESLLIQKNRENNTEAVKELKDFMDLLFKYSLNPDNLDWARPYSLEYNQKALQKTKDFFESYEWNASKFMTEIAQERKNGLLGYSEYNRTSNNPNGCKLGNKWITREQFEKIEWEDLIQMLKQYTKELPIRFGVNDHKSTVNMRLLSIIQHMYKKYTNDRVTVW